MIAPSAWPTRIAVVGAGSMGSMFGAFLARGGAKVWLVDPNAVHMAAVAARGLTLRHGGRSARVALHATTDPTVPGPVDLILFLTKADRTAAAAAAALPLAGAGTAALTLQNGLGNAESIMAALPRVPVIGGVTGIGADLVAPGIIDLSDSAATGGGCTWIGAWPGGGATEAQVGAVADRLRAGGVTVSVEADIAARVWTKLAMAAGMAALTAIARLRIDAVLETPDGVALLDAVIAETATVARARGVALDGAAVRDAAFATFRAAGAHVTSMAADILAGRQTEVAALNLAVAREAMAAGLAAPVNETVGRLVRLLEATRGRRLTRAGEGGHG